MNFPLAGEQIAHAFLSACRAELHALKPGNVHIHAPGHGMEMRHFEEAAAAAAPWIATAGLRVGARVLAAVEASMVAAGCNTNLGILLLSAPLAAAAGTESPFGTLRERLRIVLSGLDREDAANVFEAIRCAKPAGLGAVESEDVGEPPTVALGETMRLAAARDRIARAYVTAFADVFEFGLARLTEARCAAASENDAVTTLHMSYLAEFPDSHIARKYGAEKAIEVRDRARALSPLWQPAAGPHSFAALMAFDRELKDAGLNPGTTADFVVATLFTDALITLGLAQRGA